VVVNEKRTSRTESDSGQSAAPSSIPLPTYKKALYGLLPVLCLLVLAELVCRFIPDPDPRETRAGLVEPDDDLTWRLRPVSEGALKTNELGLRDTPYRADADIKILLLGDSISWGDRVENVHDLFANQLESLLSQADPGRSYEVINSGVPGYSTFQEAIYLEKQGLALDPDMVILQFCLNDVVERYHAVAEYGGDNFFLGIDTRGGMSGLTGFLARHSRACEIFLRYRQRRGRRQEAYDVAEMARDDLSTEMRQAWTLAISEIDTIREMTRQRGIPLLLLVAPYQFQLADPRARSQPQAKLADYASSRNVPYVDLLPGFAAIGRQHGLAGTGLFLDANHFSILGHASAAQLLVEPVRKLLESRPAEFAHPSTRGAD
jgi:lysophospholipase L1-like esterase